MKTKILLPIMAAILLLTLSSIQGFAQQLSASEMDKLTSNPKLNDSSAIMQNFEEGEKTTDVIIILQSVDLKESVQSSLSKTNSSISAQDKKTNITKYDLKDIKVKTIPMPILEIYKNIYNLGGYNV